MKRVVQGVVPLLFLTACVDSAQRVVAPNDATLAQGSEAPLMQVQETAGAIVPGSYIVVLREAPGLTRAATVAAGLGVAAEQLRYEYNSALNGFAADLSPEQAARIARDPRVAFVEQDRVVTLSATQSPATWGLDRIDQRTLPLSNSFTYTNTGAGVHAYIVDTGIRSTHTEFTGRVGNGRDLVQNDNTPQDCNGHGTHVAGTVGGTTYGVAKGVTLHGVRVLNCSGSGTNSGVIAGVDWVRLNHVKPAVANMSLGGSASTALDNAVASAVSAGVTFVVAAGNSSANACNYSPARTASAITVGATTSTDARASYSNFGSCLDIFAPGSSITSAWRTSNTATNTISGTSMASPHVAGVAALYLQGNPAASPSTVASALIANSTTGVVTNPGSGSPNRLLYSNY
jgi:aqualysin 1